MPLAQAGAPPRPGEQRQCRTSLELGVFLLARNPPNSEPSLRQVGAAPLETQRVSSLLSLAFGERLASQVAVFLRRGGEPKKSNPLEFAKQMRRPSSRQFGVVRVVSPRLARQTNRPAI